jgi:hypothetical protein
VVHDVSDHARLQVRHLNMYVQNHGLDVQTVRTDLARTDRALDQFKKSLSRKDRQDFEYCLYELSHESGLPLIPTQLREAATSYECRERPAEFKNWLRRALKI